MHDSGVIPGLMPTACVNITGKWFDKCRCLSKAKAKEQLTAAISRPARVKLGPGSPGIGALEVANEARGEGPELAVVVSPAKFAAGFGIDNIRDRGDIVAVQVNVGLVAIFAYILR